MKIEILPFFLMTSSKLSNRLYVLYTDYIQQLSTQREGD